MIKYVKDNITKAQKRSLYFIYYNIMFKFCVDFGISGEHGFKLLTFLAVKIVFCDFCDQTAQRNQAYQIGYCHQAVKGVVDRPDKLAVDRG